MLVFVDQNRPGTTDESSWVRANRSSDGRIVTVDDGSFETVGEAVEEGALADGTWAVQNKRRFLGQPAG
jgi:hypothetical protein